MFSRKVIAYRVALSQTTRFITKTLKQTYKSRNQPKVLIFHSDRGSQYTSHAFRTLLKEYEIIQSFSKAYSPYNNSVIESFFANLKREELYRRNYQNKNEFLLAIDKYIEFYNDKRPHMTNKL